MRNSPNSLSRSMRKRMREKNKRNQRKRRRPARKGAGAQPNRELNRQTGRTESPPGMPENIFESISWRPLTLSAWDVQDGIFRGRRLFGSPRQEITFSVIRKSST